MDPSGDDGLRDRLSARGEEALGELAEFLLENPWLNQALQVAFEARDRASQAGAQAIKGLNASETDRLERRLRSVSERLESVEDSIDALNHELAELRRRLQI